jgi:hypothetical protein
MVSVTVVIVVTILSSIVIHIVAVILPKTETAYLTASADTKQRIGITESAISAVPTVPTVATITSVAFSSCKNR